MKPLELPLFRRTAPPIETTAEVDRLIVEAAPVAIGVSGGKDSSAVAFASVAHLNAVGHRGPRILVHSDLGVTEWRESLPWCEKLASRLGLELVVVRRAKGDMMDRWEQRWTDNVARYAAMLCVRLILPWSTPAMRFCTSEMKTDVICLALSRRFEGRTILSVTGIRRQESSGRAHAMTCKPQPKLSSKTRGTAGVDWNPIAGWTLDEVLAFLDAKRFPLHPAYTRWLLTRVSCVFCIMSSLADLKAAARCPENRELYRRMVRLEIRSTFAFHGDLWLGDVAPELLNEQERFELAYAKSAAALRREAEARIPEHLLYTKGWPTCVPTAAEAELLCAVRREVAAAAGLSIEYVDPAALVARYQELIRLKKQKKRRAVPA